MLHGDLGKSLPSGTPVWSIIQDKTRNTLALALATLVILVPLSIILGVASAVRRTRTLDQSVMTSTLVLLATPEFVIGTLLATVAGVWLGLFPPVSLVDATQPLTSQTSLFVLPVLTLLAASAAQTIRMTRACMIDALQSEYVELARLKGVPERRVLFIHALPNALGPTIQVFAQNIGWCPIETMQPCRR
jgi:peptide/nickel transport system permease protein